MSTDLSLPERTELLAIALEIARDAGRFVESGWRKRMRVESKSVETDLVTEFDRESEARIREALHARTRFTVVGEERGADAGSRGAAAWYVDPIDGTTNFVHGHPFYCVSIGLVAHPDEGAPTPVLGVVVAPSLHTEWTGLVDVGAWRSGEPCRVSEVARFTDALLATGFPYDRTQPDNNFDAFVQIKKRCQAVRRCGSAAIDLCLVADGTYDGYWERKLRPWDVAAGSAIVQAAGGVLSAFDGGPADVLAGEVVASNGPIHGSLVDELRGVPSAARR
ncbi:MAG: inositol monophosphatase family protein [Polyangiaceae bacterium]